MRKMPRLYNPYLLCNPWSLHGINRRSLSGNNKNYWLFVPDSQVASDL
jgi:hypothetical protein